jgi:His-Xaa-Ser system protein HxsD
MRIVVDPAIYTVDAVKKAAYRLLHRFSPKISNEPNGIVCELTFNADVKGIDHEQIVAEFWAELLDQDLRERLGKETAAVRNAILAVAFSPVTCRSE